MSSSHASLNAPSHLREIWKQLDQGILPKHLGGTGKPKEPSPSTAAASKMSPSAPQKINVAIIGYGLSAKIFHIPLILALPDSFTLYGVVQRSPTSDNDATKDHAGIQSWRSVDEMLEDANVHLVVVSSTPETHFSISKAALEAGKHLVVEKPFMPTSAEAREISALAKEKGLNVAVYQNRRWDLDFLTLKQVLAEKDTLGHVAEFETHFDRFRPDLPPKEQMTWKNKALPAGGALYDLGSHLIDQVYALYGRPKSVYGVVQVQKRGAKLGEIAPDACTVVLRYKTEEGEETLVTVKSSSISPCEEQLRYWVRGDKGSFKKFHLDPQEDQLKAGMRPGDKGFGYEEESRFATVTKPSASTFTTKTYPSVEPATYVEYYRLVAKALQGEDQVPVSADEAADVLKIIEMAIESSENGRVVEWSE